MKSYLKYLVRILNIIELRRTYIRRSILLIFDLIILYISNLVVFYPYNYEDKRFIILLFISLSAVYLSTGTYRGITKYLNNKVLFGLIYRNAITIIIVILFGRINNFYLPDQRSFLILFFITTLLSYLTKVLLKDFIDLKNKYVSVNKYNVALYGAGKAGAQLLAALNLTNKYSVKFFIDDAKQLQGRSINGTKVISPEDFKLKYEKIDRVLISIPSLSPSKLKIIINSLKFFQNPIYKVPNLEEIALGGLTIENIKPIDTNDLLGRDPVPIKKTLLEKGIKNCSVFISGAGGSIGKELCRQVIKLQPKEILIIDINEFNLYEISNELKAYSKKVPIKSHLCDVTHKEMIEKIFADNKIDTVFHAAAYKHVPIVEDNPYAGIYNNTFSTLNLCDLSKRYKIKNFLLISSDKAVRPTNLMGATKRLSELIVQAFSHNSLLTTFCMVRFGNVLESSGSVVPLFKTQIKSKGPLTITHPKITRFFMTIPEAALLVIQSISLAKGGEVFLLDMGEPIKVKDLATQMIKLSGLKLKNKDNPEGDIEIKYTGLRPGEKLYEELLIDAPKESTDHPLIFKAIENSHDFNYLMKNIELLKYNLFNFNKKEVYQIINKLVKDWKISKYLKD